MYVPIRLDFSSETAKALFDAAANRNASVGCLLLESFLKQYYTVGGELDIDDGASIDEIAAILMDIYRLRTLIAEDGGAGVGPMLMLRWIKEDRIYIETPTGDTITLVHGGNGRQGGKAIIGVEADTKYRVVRSTAIETAPRVR